jgi:hypothetical protein
MTEPSPAQIDPRFIEKAREIAQRFIGSGSNVANRIEGCTQAIASALSSEAEAEEIDGEGDPPERVWIGLVHGRVYSGPLKGTVEYVRRDAPVSQLTGLAQFANEQAHKMADERIAELESQLTLKRVAEANIRAAQEQTALARSEFNRGLEEAAKIMCRYCRCDDLFEPARLIEGSTRLWHKSKTRTGDQVQCDAAAIRALVEK